MSITKNPEARTTGNPMFAYSALRRGNRDVVHADPRQGTVSIEGTALKTLLLIGLLIASAATVWVTVGPKANTPINPALFPVLLVGCIGGLIMAFWTAFSPTSSPVTAPIYAILEGMAIGGISAIFEYQFPGIVFQATAATIGAFVAILALYGSGVIKVNETFKAVLMSAILAICFAYLATLILNLFGTTIPYIHGSGPVGIGFSVIVCIVASLSLAWDFQNVVDARNAGAPRWFEWYLGFGLLVTLIWLYLEILRLLAKLQSRD